MTSQDNLRLDTDQLEAARVEVGPVLVEGAPGSGKTTVLITRAVLLLRNNVPPKSIFFLTPNNRQALEIEQTFTGEVQRLTKKISAETADAVQKATPQAFAISYLRRFGAGTQGVPSDFTLWSRRKTAEVIGLFATAGNHGLGVSASDIPDVIRWQRFRQSRLPEIAVHGIPSHWQEVMQLYEQEKRRENALDEGDVIPKAIEAMRLNPEQLQDWRDKVMPHFLVDGFQNLTQSEYSLLQMAAGRDGSIMAAADRNQCVGSWWGADSSLPDRFIRDNPKAKRFTLQVTYGASQALHEVACHLARQGALAPIRDQPTRTAGRQRGAKPRMLQFHSTVESMDADISQYLKNLHQKGRPWEDMAVLCRRHSSIDRLRPSISLRDVPHTVLGDARALGMRRGLSGLTLSTIHASQGRRWGFVLILDASDDVIPGRLGTPDLSTLAEEERLFYVAVTRAAEALDVAYNSQGGRARVTRFMGPIQDLMHTVQIGGSDV